MQLQMSFLKTAPPAGIAPVWTALDTEQRAEVVAALGRLIAKMAATPDEEPAAHNEEKGDE